MSEETAAIVSVDYIPAEITADYDGMREKLARYMEPYEGMDAEAIAKMDVRDVKRCRADIRKLIKSVEDGRKAIKRKYEEPLKDFEARIKDVLAPAREAEAMLKEALDEHERAARGRRYDDLMQEYAAIAGELATAVPFERFYDPAWVRSEKAAGDAAKDGLPDKARRAADDWHALQQMRGTLFDYGTAEADFFGSLDLRATIDADAARRERAAKVAEMKQNLGMSEPEPEAEPEPEPEQALRYVLKIEATQSQLDGLLGYLRQHGIQGTYGKAVG